MFRCKLPLVLSLKPWLRRLPAALSEPLGGMSLPAVDTLAEGPGSLTERKREMQKRKKGRKKGGIKRTNKVTEGNEGIEDSIYNLELTH